MKTSLTMAVVFILGLAAGVALSQLEVVKAEDRAKWAVALYHQSERARALCLEDRGALGEDRVALETSLQTCVELHSHRADAEARAGLIR